MDVSICYANNLAENSVKSNTLIFSPIPLSFPPIKERGSRGIKT